VKPRSLLSRESTAAAGVCDPTLWPDIAVTPNAPLRGRAAEAATRWLARRIPLVFYLPDGSTLGSKEGNVASITIHRPTAFFRRVGKAGLIGLGESYQAGDWEASDLADALTALAESLDRVAPKWLRSLRRLGRNQRANQDANTITGSRMNIQRHYDLSNQMFALLLDDTMTYSCALFDTEANGQSADVESMLTSAQIRKIDRILDLTGVEPGTSLLEIGTGWGELAIRAARRGAKVHTISISAEQHALAKQRIAAAGLTDRIHAELRDYRELATDGTDHRYTAIVSVEMIEAVGETFWPAYFEIVDRHLAPGGKVGIQVITMREDRFQTARRTYSWTNKYIFPGGLVPSVAAIERVLRKHTTLSILDRHAFGDHYAMTLSLWRAHLAEHANEIELLGFDRTFHRTWKLYLASCEAGFRSGYLDVHQFQIGRS